MTVSELIQILSIPNGYNYSLRSDHSVFHSIDYLCCFAIPQPKGKDIQTKNIENCSLCSICDKIPLSIMPGEYLGQIGKKHRSFPSNEYSVQWFSRLCQYLYWKQFSVKLGSYLVLWIYTFPGHSNKIFYPRVYEFSSF